MNFRIDKNKVNYISIIGAIIAFIGMFLPAVERDTILGHEIINSFKYDGAAISEIIWMVIITVLSLKGLNIAVLVIGSLMLIGNKGIPREWWLFGKYVIFVGWIVVVVGAAYYICRDKILKKG